MLEEENKINLEVVECCDLTNVNKLYLNYVNSVRESSLKRRTAVNVSLFQCRCSWLQYSQS